MDKSTEIIQRTLEKIGRMVVTEAVASDAYFQRVCTDIQTWDAKELAEKCLARRAQYGTTPFDPEGAVVRLYGGGLTVWSGYPGAGKTTLLRQLVCHCLARGSSVFLASLEEDPADLLFRLAGTAAGREEPTPHQFQWLIDAYGPRLRVWGRAGTAASDEMLYAVGACGKLGSRHAVIDSLMCLDVANDDLEAQRQFTRKLAAVARVARVHVHLVAHPRKLISADQELDINDVAGAREIAGLADNVIFVRRAKQETIQAERSPMIISVRKQRHFNGWIGDIPGWFQRDMRQFHLSQFPEGPTKYLPEDAYS